MVSRLRSKLDSFLQAPTGLEDPLEHLLIVASFRVNATCAGENVVVAVRLLSCRQTDRHADRQTDLPHELLLLLLVLLPLLLVLHHYYWYYYGY